jgi:hypothetical protein
MKTGQLLAALLLLVPSYSVSGFSVDTVRRRHNDAVVRSAREATVVRPKRAGKNKQEPSSSSSSPRVVVSAEQGNLPPVLQDIANDRMEFQRKLGKAMDTLRRDMQDILTKTPGMYECMVWCVGHESLHPLANLRIGSSESSYSHVVFFLPI